jgi:hypothetical protein
MATKVTSEDADQLSGEIDNEGFGYWIQHYGTGSLNPYPELVKLADKACTAMNKLEEALIDAGVPLNE